MAVAVSLGPAGAPTPASSGPQPRPWPSLTEVRRQVEPVTLAGERLLPVTEALRPLLPDGGLRRGTTVAVSRSTSLVLSLVAEATTTGSWAAFVGMPWVGVVAAAEAGVDLGRVAFVPRPSRERWAEVVAALVDGVDIVAVCGRGDRRLAARVRERGGVLLVAAPDRDVHADVHLEVVERHWRGLGQGHGHLEECEVVITTTGRGAASRGRANNLVARPVGLGVPTGAGGRGPKDPGARRKAS